MTAEIFLASTLGCLVAIIVTCVFFKTVYMPVQGYLMKRAFARSVAGSSEWLDGAAFPSPSLVSPLDIGDDESRRRMEHFDAGQVLCLAALEVPADGGQGEHHSEQWDQGVAKLVVAARAYQRTTTPRMRKQMRAMEAFRKAQHAPDDPV